jgi:hypothetical protein
METKLKLKITDEIISVIVDHIQDIAKSKWKLGDLLVMLVDMHQKAGYKRSEVLNAICGETAITYTTLDDYERTSRKWAKEDRLPNVDWTIYRNAQPEDFPLIEQAADEGWNATRFKLEKYPAMQSPKNFVVKAIQVIRRINIQNITDKSVLERINAIVSELENLLDSLG